MTTGTQRGIVTNFGELAAASDLDAFYQLVGEQVVEHVISHDAADTVTCLPWSNGRKPEELSDDELRVIDIRLQAVFAQCARGIGRRVLATVLYDLMGDMFALPLQATEHPPNTSRSKAA